MKNTASRATWGILFILLGVALAGRAFGLFDFSIFFRGWWTLFIIIPCATGLSDRNKRTSSLIGLGIGILLLLSAQGIFTWYIMFRVLIAFLFVAIGCSILTKGNRKERYDDNTITDKQSYTYADSGSNSGYTNANTNSNYKRSNNGTTNHGGYNHFSGILSGRTVQFVDELFTGAVISSILGNVQLDLRNAIINDNVIVETTCILGGVDIYVPSNVKVVVNCTPILAGVDNDIISPSNANEAMYTLFINGTCILGGIEVK